MIPLSKPDITEKEKKAVLAVLDTDRLSLGPRLDEFERKIADYVGVKYAVAVNSGTSALHLIVKALGIKERDEVITTPFSFISSSNCILYERAKPVFVDIDPETYNIDVSKIESKITAKTKAILAVDIFGRPAEWDALQAISKKHHLMLIEDSAEALGSEYHNKKCGGFGDAGVFAFYPNKQITTGEGGMIVTNNESIYKLCKSMRNQGRDNSEWLQHDRIGYNYRLSEINCALGLAQMDRIKDILAKRDRVVEIYNEHLKDILDMTIPKSEENKKISLFAYVVKLSNKFSKENRDKIIGEMMKKGIECSNYLPPIHLQPIYLDMFGYKKGDFPVCEELSERTIALPFYNNLTEEEIGRITKILKEVIIKYKNDNI